MSNERLIQRVELIFEEGKFRFNLPDSHAYRASDDFQPCRPFRSKYRAFMWFCWTYLGEEEDAFPVLLDKAREDIDAFVSEFDNFAGNEIIKKNYLERWKK